MRQTALLLIMLAVVTMVPQFAGAACEPENPYLFCGYWCSSNSCVSGPFTPPEWVCWLTFPGCDDDTSHECCRDNLLLF